MTVSRAFAPDNAPTTQYTGNGVIISSNADIDALEDITVTNTSGAYTLTYPRGAGTATVSGTLNTSATPNTVTFTGIADENGGLTGTITIPLHATDTALGYNIPSGSTVTIGQITSLTDYNVKATTVDKSGSTVTLNDTWDGTATTLNLGDITITLNAAEFQNALDDGFTDVEIGNVGAGPGEPVKIAHIAVAKFTNPNGLSQDGEGYYIETTNSGEAVATIPGKGGTGTFRAGALEMSNVDLSREFTEMIITQRGFQANTRMITTSDEMLSELVSMKR